MSPHKRKIFSSKKTLLTELRVLQVALAVLLGLVLAGGAAMLQIHKDRARIAEMRHEAIQPPNGSIGGAFALTDQNGKMARDTDFRGKYLLVYFGYTYCPDLCPTGLQSIAKAMDRLGPEADKIQPVFITIDPARDTPAKLKDYVASFHPKIIGLSGSEAEIAAAAKAYQVYYAKGENVEDGEYLMDHSSLIYLMDPAGKFVTTFPDEIDPAAMTDAIRTLWKQAGESPAKTTP